jgi:molybdopterin converting factor small subunit
MNGVTAIIRVKVELFGTPRIHCGTTAVELSVPYPANRNSLVAALAKQCPPLVGHGLKEDLTGLDDGYVFNLNGLAFLGDADFILADGDSLLLLSSQAGG